MKHCSRLSPLRLKLKGGKDIYIINGHAPDSGQTVAKRQAFQQKLERALRAAGSNDVLILMGDFNAAAGTADDDGDEVSGEHGTSHVNAAGKELKMLATAHGLQDLVTMEEQSFYGTWVHPQSKTWHQLDRIFMRKSQRHMVNKCRNAEMLKVSVHFSVRLNLTISPPPQTPYYLASTKQCQESSRHIFEGCRRNGKAEESYGNGTSI
jgi:endonuclease/exonuclease/phosphatase family metal-dependent hydrolase